MMDALAGAFAALATPVQDDGRPDLPTFERLIDFVLERGVDGTVVGGGTGEYIDFGVAERIRLASLAAKRINGRRKLITCIGTSSIHSTRELVRGAEDAGSDALLIPMPYFFRYEQEDLAAFCEAVCGTTSLPCLLYNLPSFTNPILPETALSLMHRIPNLIGMKDSSGETSHLESLARGREGKKISLLVGDDSLLFGALDAGWDGVISGIASFAPELIVAVYQAFRAGRKEEARQQQQELDTVIEEIVRLPIPWGVRVGLSARGIANGPLHLPASGKREAQIAELKNWLKDWATQRGTTLEQIWPTLPVRLS